MISVVTVPHTGTIYTLNLLKRWGHEVERKHLENTDPPPHGGDRFGPDFPCASSDYWDAYPIFHRVVCTLRDPMLAVISGINRGLPDRMISIDGWTVMADWWALGGEYRCKSVHFFPIPPTLDGLTSLARFVGAPFGWMHEVELEPTNTHEDRTGIRGVYNDVGCGASANRTFRRCVAQLQERPEIEAMFADHGFDLPWFAKAR